MATDPTSNGSAWGWPTRIMASLATGVATASIVVGLWVWYANRAYDADGLSALAAAAMIVPGVVGALCVVTGVVLSRRFATASRVLAWIGILAWPATAALYWVLSYIIISQV